MSGLEMTRRAFTKLGVMSPLALSEPAQAQMNPNNATEYDFQGVVELRGALEDRPVAGGEFFDNKVYYAYRYRDEVTGATWFTTQDLNEWHPEPLGAADVSEDGGHASSIVSRDGDLYVRRYE